MTEDSIKKLQKIERLQSKMNDLTDAILILEKQIPDRYVGARMEAIDACVSRALYSLSDEERINAFRMKIDTLKKEIANQYLDLSIY